MRMCISHVFIQASGIDLDALPMFDDCFQNCFKDICIIRKAEGCFAGWTITDGIVQMTVYGIIIKGLHICKNGFKIFQQCFFFRTSFIVSGIVGILAIYKMRRTYNKVKIMIFICVGNDLVCDMRHQAEFDTEADRKFILVLFLQLSYSRNIPVCI